MPTMVLYEYLNNDKMTLEEIAKPMICIIKAMLMVLVSCKEDEMHMFDEISLVSLRKFIKRTTIRK